jgi:hypothetical protein
VSLSDVVDTTDELSHWVWNPFVPGASEHWSNIVQRRNNDNAPTLIPSRALLYFTHRKNKAQHNMVGYLLRDDPTYPLERLWTRFCLGYAKVVGSDEERMLMGRSKVFSKITGNDWLRKRYKAVGRPDVQVHDLRRGGANRVFRASQMDIRAVQRAGGWTSQESAERYLFSDPAVVAETLQRRRDEGDPFQRLEARLESMVSRLSAASQSLDRLLSNGLDGRDRDGDDGGVLTKVPPHEEYKARLRKGPRTEQGTADWAGTIVPVLGQLAEPSRSVSPQA